jgi:hypothetical protein
MYRIALYIFLILLPNTASAAYDSQFKNYITNNVGYNNALKLAITRVHQLTYPNCDIAPKLSKRFQDIILPVIFNQSDIDNENKDDDIADNKIEEPSLPIYGQWIERVLVETCKKQTVINHLAVAYSESEPIMLPLINGRTKLGVIDQPLAEKAIADRLNKLDNPCEADAFIIDTNIIGYRTKDGKGINNENNDNGWFEKWDLRACGAEYEAKIAILPDPRVRYNYIVRLYPKK